MRSYARARRLRLSAILQVRQRKGTGERDGGSEEEIRGSWSHLGMTIPGSDRGPIKEAASSRGRDIRHEFYENEQLSAIPL